MQEASQRERVQKPHTVSQVEKLRNTHEMEVSDQTLSFFS